MTRLRSLIKEVLSQPKKKDCGCGCNDCGGKAPILTEGKVKHLISEGLQYHMDKKIQLHESVYRIGSEKHFELIREARALWVRGIIDVSEDDQAILETNLGHFGMYEGEEVPLDMPMVNEEVDEDGFNDKIIKSVIKPEEVSRLSKVLNSNNIPFKTEKLGKVTMFKFKSYDDVDKVEALISRNRIDIDEGFYSSPSDLEDSGLNVIPKDQIHANKLQDALENSGLYGEWNPREGYFFFPEEEDGYDQLEMEIQDLMDENNIQGYIEGVFEESLNEVHKLLRQTNLSSEEYQKAKKLKGFNADNYTFSSDNNLYVKKESVDEVDRYSGFNRNPEDPDSVPFEPKGSVAQFKEDLRALFGKFKGDLKNPEFIKGVAQIMVNWKSLLRSQLDEATYAGREVKVIKNDPEDMTTWEVEFSNGKRVPYADTIANIKLEEKKKAKPKKKDPPIGKPKRGGSKAYYVYVRDPKTKRIKKVSFGSGGLRAKIRNPKARKAFAARHKCSQKNDRTKPSYWSCRLPRYAKQLGLGSNMNTFW